MKKAVKALSIILICWCSLMIVLYLGVIVLTDIEWAPPGWLWMLINSASYLIIWRYSDRTATVCAHNGSLDHLAHPLWPAFGRAFAALDGSYGRMPRHSVDSVH